MLCTLPIHQVVSICSCSQTNTSGWFPAAKEWVLARLTPPPRGWCVCATGRIKHQACVCQTVELHPPSRRGEGMGEGVQCPHRIQQNTQTNHRQAAQAGTSPWKPRPFRPQPFHSRALCLKPAVNPRAWDRICVSQGECFRGPGGGLLGDGCGWGLRGHKTTGHLSREDLFAQDVSVPGLLVQAPTTEAQSQWLKSGSRAPGPNHCTQWREANPKGNWGVCVLSC